jgi:hypothetical protein
VRAYPTAADNAVAPATAAQSAMESAEDSRAEQDQKRRTRARDWPGIVRE